MTGAMMLPEFDHEASLTRKTLERVPFERGDWKPHEKSFSLKALAGHLADIPSWVDVTINQDVFEMDGPYQPETPDTTEVLLERFDRNTAAAREVLAGASQGDLLGMWSMKQGGEVTLTMPKIAVLRGFILSHAIHHRAQLGLYLRLLDVPVPATYGPSADEAG
jgi:uncharacterized damage-inducible protein DinB